MDDPWTNNEAQARGEARTDREQCRSSAPDDLRGPHRQDETRKTVDLGHSSDGPSSIDPAAIRINTTESSFAACLNRLLQQNRPLADVRPNDLDVCFWVQSRRGAGWVVRSANDPKRSDSTLDFCV